MPAVICNETRTRSAEARASRYWLRDQLQHLVYRYSASFGAGVDGARAARAARRLAVCGCRKIRKGDPVGVHVGGAGGSGYSNVQVCGSTWACPTCGAKVRQKRAGEVDQAVLAATGKRPMVLMGDVTYQHDMGGGLLTMTVAHDQGDSLKSVLTLVAGAWRGIRKSRAGAEWWQRWGVRATIRSLEVTHSDGYGWHPHLHVVLFFARALSDEARADCEAQMLRMWKGQVQASVRDDGSPWRLPNQHGARLDLLRTPKDWRDAGQYVVEVSDEHGKARSLGLEVARHDLKVGRRDRDGRAPAYTPFQLAAMACEGDAPAGRLWAEFVTATHGRQAITFSAGLRKMFQLADAATDEELAQEADDGERLLTLTDAEWRLVRAAPGGRGGVLEAAEAFGQEGVASLLVELAAWRARLPDG